MTLAGSPSARRRSAAPRNEPPRRKNPRSGREAGRRRTVECRRAAAIALAILFLTAGRVAPARAQSQSAAEALHDGAYEDAEAAARSALSVVERAARPDPLVLARALDDVVAAATANGKAGERSTLELARRARQLKERPGIAGDERAATLHLLGLVHEQRGEFRTALALQARALAARRATPRIDRALVADSVDAYARALVGLERWSEAEHYLNGSLTTREADAANAPLALARTLELVARVKREVGRYREAAADLDRALEMWNRWAPIHPDKAAALEVRGYVSFLLGDITGARQYWVDGDQLTRATLRPLHPLRAHSARNLAVAEMALGNLRAARDLRQAGVAIAERSMPPCDPEFAAQLNDLAIALQYDAEYAAADRMLQRELDTIRRCRGSSHSAAATAIYNQFALAREVGRYAEAERLGQLAVDRWLRTLGPNHPFVAFGLNDLADFLTSRGSLSRAQTLFTRALRIRQRVLGPVHPDVAWTLTGLARAKALAGDRAGARTLVTEAITMLEATPARDPDYLPAALTVRGAIEMQAGQYHTARDTLTAAVQLRERSLGPRHALVASARADLAAADLALGESARAFDTALQAESDARALLRFSVRYMPEQRALEYAAARPRGLDLALSILTDAPDGSGRHAAAALDAVIRSRGIVLDELAARARTTAGADPALAPLAKAVSDARRQLAALILRTTGAPSEDSTLIERIRVQKEQAEAALAAESGKVRMDLARADAGLDDVRRALPPRTALISFVRYNRSAPVGGGGGAGRRDIPSYLVFVSRADATEIASVALGSAVSLDRLVTEWRGAVAGQAALATGATQRYREVASRLRRQIWDPLAPHLIGLDRALVVPDGALNLVSLAALPTREGSYLIEDGPTIHYLTTERDLLQEADSLQSRGLLLLGGAAYGSLAATPRPTPGCAGVTLAFPYLPGTRAEIDSIATLWSSAAAQSATKGEDFKVLSGSAARKAAVVDAAPGRRILHLATHGFFLSGCAGPPNTSLRGVGGLATRTPSSREANPLLLSGLALAGANAAGRGSRDNGLLTAEEVSALNLQGTEWAVLSACETGVGQTTSGEGVLGLRRGFQVAGVRTIILSLWSVQDRSTRDWMVALYRARLVDGQDTAQAVRTAGLRVLEERRARGLSTHPFYWAAFASAGDWR